MIAERVERAKAATIPRTVLVILQGPKALRREQFVPGPLPLTENQQDLLPQRFPDVFQGG